MFTSPDLRRIAVSVAAFGLAAGFPTAVTGGTADARTSQLVSGVSVASDGPPFAGDSARDATVSPNGDGFRDAAVVRFGLRQPARVTLGAYASGEGATAPRLVGRRTVQLAAGSHTLQWQPRQTLTPRTYMVRLDAVDGRGGRSTVGTLGAGDPSAHVVRVLGLDAGFTRPSYEPGARARLVVSADVRAFTLQLFRAGPETNPSIGRYGGEALWGVPVGAAKPFVWGGARNHPVALRVRIPHAPTGLYFERLTTADGQVGFAPFVLLPSTWGTHRAAVVFPTNTWQAYNHRDLNGDGWGDTWYATRSVTHVDLTRPYLHRGVPTRFRGYQLGFLRWLYQSGKQVDFLSDRELEGVSGDRLRHLYRMLVFLGHHEYVTAHAYDSVVRFRDLGGSLIFTSATNFLYEVHKQGRWMIGRKAWRSLGRPEAALIGVQYLDNDFGRHQGHYGVVGAATAPWAFAGTGMVNTSRFGHGGIEIDARAPASPPGTLLLATMKNLHGPGRSAEMTYYSTRSGARVFASGTLNFAGTALDPRVSALLENVWRHLLQRPG